MDNYEYNRKLFREFLAYPSKEQLFNYEDRRRLELLEQKVMKWIDDGVD